MAFKHLCGYGGTRSGLPSAPLHLLEGGRLRAFFCDGSRPGVSLRSYSASRSRRTPSSTRANLWTSTWWVP